MNELIKAVVACIEKVVDKAEILTPLLQVIAVIIGLCVIGVMVLRGIGLYTTVRACARP
ncbi:hypothetical protein [Ralstonia solanacearum]|uniref:hypothetical protein n=1 Tax=Ralstonia solanacearum TaxID=305 RepID=UPI001865A3D2|nr:hypothetical protein [Ralstonia solanacearum]QOK81210.1 hypothetical protein HF906_02965 [Ralstonia solanacearum]